jgi:hypothetical protein
MKWSCLTRKHAIYYNYHFTGFEVLIAVAVDACFMLLSCLAYPSTLKIEEICCSEISDSIHRTTRLHLRRL